MGCRICLDAYTPDERPAALPCGHVFHHACLQDWLTTRTHGAVPRDGLGMLVEQAAEAFALWRGVRPPSAEVLAELRAVVDAA